MDKMSVFSDAVNESFNYTEITWKGNTYLVDFNNRGSLVKLIKAVTGESDLNEGIRQLPDEILEQTPYSKFQEHYTESFSDKVSNVLDKLLHKRSNKAQGNWVLYKKDQYIPMQYLNDIAYLCYIGDSTTPEQPVNVKSTFRMFCDNRRLQSLDLTKWDMSQVTNMYYMFGYCVNLTSVNLLNWDVSHVECMHGMFYRCESLISLDLSTWKCESCKDMQSMFFDCNSLTSLELAGWSILNDVMTDGMFVSCTSLQTTHNQEFDKLLKKRDEDNG